MRPGLLTAAIIVPLSPRFHKIPCPTRTCPPARAFCPSRSPSRQRAAVPRGRDDRAVRDGVEGHALVQRHVPLQVVHGLVRPLAVLAVDGFHQRVDAAVQLSHVAARGARRVGDLEGPRGAAVLSRSTTSDSCPHLLRGACGHVVPQCPALSTLAPTPRARPSRPRPPAPAPAAPSTRGAAPTAGPAPAA